MLETLLHKKQSTIHNALFLCITKQEIGKLKHVMKIDLTMELLLLDLSPTLRKLAKTAV